MIQIQVENKDINGILQISNDLKAQGIVQGKDFDFAYHPSRWNKNDGKLPSYTIFTFYNEQLATLFVLKWL